MMSNVYLTVLSALIFVGLGVWIYRQSREKESTLFDNKSTVKGFITLFYISLALLLGADFLIHKHEHIEIGNMHEFYPIYGVLSCVVLMIVVKITGLLVKRNSDYYND